MNPGQTSHDLLAHFDRPKTVDLPDFEWVDEIIPLEPQGILVNRLDSAESSTRGFIELPQITRRGIRWVVTWAAALVVLAVATSVLIEFAYVLAAEHTLAIAARAGAMEATLPRATYRSVATTVERRLANYPLLAKDLHMSLTQNGSLVQSQFRQHDGDRFAIALSAPNISAMPNWLRCLVFSRGEARIQSRAEQQMPGRKLTFGASLPIHTAAE